MRSPLILAAAACAVLVSGCFWFGNEDRRILGSYRLEQWEDGATYYLVKRGAADSGGGVIEGTVIEIGWNDRYILVNRHANARSDSDGWMYIDSESGKLVGPDPKLNIRSRPEILGIQVYSAKVAWGKLWIKALL
jgi:hypothetical protein